MEPNNTYEQEIDLKDLMFAVLRKWRPALLVAVILAVLLGGYKLATTYRSLKDPDAIVEAAEKYEKDLALYEKSLETCQREIENLQNDIVKQQEYLEDSVMLNMSAYDVWEAVTSLVVKTDYVILPEMMFQNTDYTRTVMQAYQSALTSTEFLTEVAAANNSQARYLKELLDVSVDGSMLTIKVRYKTQAEAQKIMEMMLQKVEELTPGITESIGNHTIAVVNESLGSSVDLSLADQQRSESTRLETLKTSLETKEKELEEMEKPKKNETTTTAALKTGIKFAVLGGVLGVFMVVFFVCVSFLMSDKVYAAKELRNRYQLKILGKLPVAGRKKPGAIDRWLNRLEDRAEAKNAEREYGLIAANIRNYGGGLKSLLVIGTVTDAVLCDLAERLGRELPEVKIIFGGNVLEDASALQKLPECDGVILAEQCGMSVYGRVELEIEKARDLQKQVVGCVVFE